MKFNTELFSKHMRIRIAIFRLKLGDAAKEIGISKATLSRINREIGLPDVETFGKCCKWLETDMTMYFEQA